MKHMNKNNPFKTPEGYFDSLKDRLLDAVSSDDSGLPADDGFSVPENYFDSLNERIGKRLPDKSPKVIPLFGYKQVVYAVSAAAAVFLLVFGLQFRAADSPQFDTLASADIENYLQSYAGELNTYEIADELDVRDLGISDVMDENLEEENIIEYLDDEIDDLDDLNFEFDE